MTLTDAERDYVAGQILGRLATVRPDGSLQNNPVAFTYDPDRGTVDITGRAMGQTSKFRNVAANGEAALVVDDVASFDPWTARGVEIRGWAEALRDEEPSSSYATREVIRIHPRRVISWGVDPASPGMSGRDIDH